jgi:hypothetical protein
MSGLNCRFSLRAINQRSTRTGLRERHAAAQPAEHVPIVRRTAWQVLGQFARKPDIRADREAESDRQDADTEKTYLPILSLKRERLREEPRRSRQ